MNPKGMGDYVPGTEEMTKPGVSLDNMPPDAGACIHLAGYSTHAVYLHVSLLLALQATPRSKWMAPTAHPHSASRSTSTS
jgi:hypothetical protein